MALTPGQGLAILLIFIFFTVFILLALAKWKLAQFVAAVLERHGTYGFGPSQGSDGESGDLEAREDHDNEGSSSTSSRSISSDSSES